MKPLPVMLTAVALLAGCSGLLHSTAQPEQTYYLRAPLAAAAAPAQGPAVSLRVGRPLADPGLDSQHIMLVQSDHRLDFYSGARWPAPAPEVIESLAVQTLRASAQWASVEDSRSPFTSSYLLQTVLRRFDAEYAAGGGAPEVHVVLDCLIGRREGRDVVATFTASGSAPAAANRLADVVAAFEQATGAALESLSQQALAAVRADGAAQNGAAPTPSSSRHSQ